MNLNEMIAVMVACGEGKPVERCDDVAGDYDELHQDWEMCGQDHDFNFAEYIYRIRPPKPREWWVPVFKDGTCGCAVPTSSKRAASFANGEKPEWVTVKEVR